MIETVIFGISIFFLTFLIVFGILNRLNIFNSKFINYIISLSVAFYSLLTLNYLNSFSSFLSFLLLSLLFILFIAIILIGFSIIRKIYKKNI